MKKGSAPKCEGVRHVWDNRGDMIDRAIARVTLGVGPVLLVSLLLRKALSPIISLRALPTIIWNAKRRGHKSRRA